MDVLSIIGWGGSALVVASLLQARILRLRVLNLIGCVILVGFNLAIGVWPMVGMNLATSSINIWFITRMLRERHDEAAFHVLQVGPADAYLLHFLGVHRTDIARHQPGFAATDLGEDDLAFQVEKGDETVGVILIRRDGDVARVLLDYVTPRYRDFSPGEFVWRRASRLRDRGFRKVLTPPGMVSPYYDRLGHGFRREGESYVLNL